MYSFIKLCKQDTVKVFENTQSCNNTPNKGEMLLNKNKTRTDYVFKAQKIIILFNKKYQSCYFL